MAHQRHPVALGNIVFLRFSGCRRILFLFNEAAGEENAVHSAETPLQLVKVVVGLAAVHHVVHDDTAVHFRPPGKQADDIVAVLFQF